MTETASGCQVRRVKGALFSPRSSTSKTLAPETEFPAVAVNSWTRILDVKHLGRLITLLPATEYPFEPYDYNDMASKFIDENNQ